MDFDLGSVSSKRGQPLFELLNVRRFTAESKFELLLAQYKLAGAEGTNFLDVI